MTSTNWWHPLVNKEQGPSEERFNKGCLIDPFGEKLAGERFWRNSCRKGCLIDPFGEKLAGESYCGNHTQNLWQKLSRRLFDWSSWRETSWTIKVTQKTSGKLIWNLCAWREVKWRRAGSQGSTKAAGKESSRAPKLLLAITFDWSRGGRFRP